MLYFDHPPLKIFGCLSIMTPSKLGKTKHLIFYSLYLLVSLTLTSPGRSSIKVCRLVGLSSTCNYVNMTLAWENHAIVDMKNISRHASTCLIFQSNGTQKYVRNNKIMSNFSRDTTIVVFCWPSFILWSQCALYFWVCSISRLFLCAMNINELVISITSPRSRHGKLTVR